MNYGIGFASIVRFRCYSMEAINLAQVFEENYYAWAIIFWKSSGYDKHWHVEVR